MCSPTHLVPERFTLRESTFYVIGDKDNDDVTNVFKVDYGLQLLTASNAKIKVAVEGIATPISKKFFRQVVHKLVAKQLTENLLSPV